MDKAPLTFRMAERKDAPLILQFIRELARYEKLEQEVVATESLLEEWIFDKGKAEVLFALAGGKEVGFALFFHTFSTFLGRARADLEDLYVMPEYRGQGYGKGICASWPKSPWRGAAAAWNGGAWIGTGPASIFICPWGRSPWRSGPCIG